MDSVLDFFLFFKYSQAIYLGSKLLPYLQFLYLLPLILY